MKHQVSRTAAAIATLLVLSACADSTESDPITGPSARRGGAPRFTVTDCSGVLPPGTYDNIRVPAGDTCTINGSLITGNVLALENSRLFMSSDRVFGFVKGDGADMVWITGGTTVGDQIFLHRATLSAGVGIFNVNISGGTVVTGGNIHIENMDVDMILVAAQVTNGSVELIDNTTHTLLQVEQSQVSQSIDVFGNGGPSGKFVANNTAGVAVRCFDNTGAVFAGGPNSAPSRQGQCF